VGIRYKGYGALNKNPYYGIFEDSKYNSEENKLPSL
jgi:hypothetical protein